MGDVSTWTLVDKFVSDPSIKNWDATTLEEVSDNSCEQIYASHLLEHIPHVDVPGILNIWYRKIKSGGKLTINVPDLSWAAMTLIEYDLGKELNGYYDRFEGEHGLQSIFYGSQSHKGEFHKSGYIRESVLDLLEKAGFSKISIEQVVDAHDMGVIIATGEKE